MTIKLKNSPLAYMLMQVNIDIMKIAEYIPDLQEQIRRDFPDSEKTTTQMLNLLIGSFQVNQVEQWYFKDRDQTTGLIVNANNFFIHTTNYNTFEEILEKYTNVLVKFNHIVNNFSYNRLGLRYVNFIPEPDSNMQSKFLGFNLTEYDNIEHEYISKTETIQKTSFGSVRVKATTFNDHTNQYTINQCIPPELTEAASKLTFNKFSSQLLDRKCTIFDIDHHAINAVSNDFSATEIKDNFRNLHSIIGTVFESAITSNAIKEWS